MTDKEELTRGDALARVAVLEDEVAELRKRVCVPEGWRVVPVEPSAAMAIAGREFAECGIQGNAVFCYRAMLAAAPAPVERCPNCLGRGEYAGVYGRHQCDCAAPAPVERVEQEAVSYYERAHGEKSPTHGMSLDERIAHVGGRTNAAGYVEFGSVMAVSALIDHVLRDSPAPQPAPTAAQDNWISVAERMPPAGTKVLAFYRNSMGVSRRICAEYIGKHQRDAFDFDQDCEADYDEATDQYYWPEGWYERVDNWDELTHLAVTEGEITHWRVMPAVPGLDAHQSGGAK